VENPVLIHFALEQNERGQQTGCME